MSDAPTGGPGRHATHRMWAARLKKRGWMPHPDRPDRWLLDVLADVHPLTLELRNPADGHWIIGAYDDDTGRLVWWHRTSRLSRVFELADDPLSGFTPAQLARLSS